jgi:hypothetical protein
VQSRIEAFAVSLRARLAAMTDEEVRSKGAILGDRLVEPDKTPSAEAGRMWSPVSFGGYGFHGSEKLGAAVRALGRDDLLAVWDACVMPGGNLVRKLVSRVYALRAAAGQAGAAGDAGGGAGMLGGGPAAVPPPAGQDPGADGVGPCVVIDAPAADGAAEFVRAMRVVVAGETRGGGGRGEWLPPLLELSGMSGDEE